MFDGDYDYKPLGDLFKTSSGGTPLKSKQEYYREGDTPWLTSGEINKLHITSANTKITRLALEETSAKIPPIGSVLVSMYGSIGYAGILEFESAINQAICAIHPNEHFVPVWLCYYIRSKKDNLTNQGAGAALTNISQEKIRKLRVMCPPVELQNQFADFVKQVDKSKLVFRAMVSKLDELVKTRYVEMFGKIDNFDKNYETKPWKQVLEIRNGKDYKTIQSNRGTFPVYGSGGIIAYVDEYSCPEDSIIIGRKGTINRPILVREKYWNVDTAFCLIPNKKVLNEAYLFWFCTLYDFNKHNKATTLPSLTKSDLLKIKMNIPPIHLQNQFADFVKQIDKLKFQQAS